MANWTEVICTLTLAAVKATPHYRPHHRPHNSYGPCWLLTPSRYRSNNNEIVNFIRIGPLLGLILTSPVGAYFYSPASKQPSNQSRQASYKSAVVRQSAFSYFRSRLKDSHGLQSYIIHSWTFNHRSSALTHSSPSPTRAIHRLGSPLF